MLTATTPPPSSMRRTLLRVCLIGAIVGIALAATPVVWARFFAAPATETNTFSAGTVTLTTSATHTCSVSGLLPGVSPTACTLQATYGGSVSAYLSLDVLIATKSGSPGTTPLYNPSDATNDLQITVSDNQGSPVSYVTPSTSFGSALASCPAGSGFDSSYTCYQQLDLLVSTTPFSSSSSPVIFSTAVTLPAGNPSSYQGGTASIALTVHAAQSTHQSLSGCSAGAVCSAVSWS